MPENMNKFGPFRARRVARSNLGPGPFRAFRPLHVRYVGAGVVSARCLVLGPFQASQVFRFMPKTTAGVELRPFRGAVSGEQGFPDVVLVLLAAIAIGS